VNRPSRTRRLGPLRHPAFARLWLADPVGPLPVLNGQAALEPVSARSR